MKAVLKVSPGLGFTQPAGEPPAAKTQRAVQSVEVGGKLLLAMANNMGPLSLKDLAAQAGLSPSRAHPYLVSYCKLGLVAQDLPSGYYALGPSALQIGLTCLHQLDVVKAATPVAKALADSTGHAVALAVWGNFGPTITRMIDARQPLHVAMRAGTVMSMFGTATGRAFVGSLPRARIAEAISGPLGGDSKSIRATSATAKKKFDREIKAITAELKTYGVARAVGKPIPGVNAFSAPIYNHEGEALLVITMLGHQDHFASSWTSSMAKQVRLAADEISKLLGFSARRA